MGRKGGSFRICCQEFEEMLGAVSILRDYVPWLV